VIIGNKTPTVHSLRHTYVVSRVNNWMTEGVNVSNMMPYLSRQLGHSSVDGSQYYFHTSIAAIPVIHSRDRKSSNVIPNPVHVCSEGSIEQHAARQKPLIDKMPRKAPVERIIPEVKEFESKTR